MKSYIKIWCEYDICGPFGGNNNEQVLVVDHDEHNVDRKSITEIVEKYVIDMSGCSKDEIDGLWTWNFISIMEIQL